MLIRVTTWANKNSVHYHSISECFLAFRLRNRHLEFNEAAHKFVKEYNFKLNSISLYTSETRENSEFTIDMTEHELLLFNLKYNY